MLLMEVVVACVHGDVYYIMFDRRTLKSEAWTCGIPQLGNHKHFLEDKVNFEIIEIFRIEHFKTCLKLI